MVCKMCEERKKTLLEDGHDAAFKELRKQERMSSTFIVIVVTITEKEQKKTDNHIAPNFFLFDLNIMQVYHADLLYRFCAKY